MEVCAGADNACEVGARVAVTVRWKGVRCQVYAGRTLFFLLVHVWAF